MASNLRVDTILPSTGTNVAIGTASGSVTFLGDTDITTSGSVSIGGTLTYEDVTNIDSVGLITARTGIKIGPTAGVAGTFFTDGSYITAGIITATTFHGSGANLTSLPAANLTGTLPAISGANLTGLTNGVTMIDMWRFVPTYNIPHNSTAIISTENWERPDRLNDAFGQLGTGMSRDASAYADGEWTFPSTGFYMVSCGAEVFSSSANGTEVTIRMETTEDNSSFGLQTWFRVSGPQNYWRGGYGHVIMDVTNTTNVKFRLRIYSDSSGQVLYGDTNENRTYLSFIRLADT